MLANAKSYLDKIGSLILAYGAGNVPAELMPTLEIDESYKVYLPSLGVVNDLIEKFNLSTRDTKLHRIYMRVILKTDYSAEDEALVKELTASKTPYTVAYIKMLELGDIPKKRIQQTKDNEKLPGGLVQWLDQKDNYFNLVRTATS